jgi:N-acetylglucosaminyldiphosphoundecaprenol N-acetyl-beta-D-mannosaminyltransferase
MSLRSVATFGVLGVNVSALTEDRAVGVIHDCVVRRERTYICVANVHGVVESLGDAALRTIYNRAGLVTPDGMPLVWVGGHKGFDVGRVYGPDLMLALCGHGVRHGYRHFLFGGDRGVAARLAASLEERFPGIVIAGTYTPPFGEWDAAERERIIHAINAARADIVWVGLGAPRQEHWMSAYRDALNASLLIGVGAAFDFNAGLKPQAPKWIQRAGLEWLFRLLSEPRRLWRRYFRTNPRFLFHISLQLLGVRRY